MQVTRGHRTKGLIYSGRGVWHPHAPCPASSLLYFDEVTWPAHRRFWRRKRAREQGKRTSEAELDFKEDLEVFIPKVTFLVSVPRSTRRSNVDAHSPLSPRRFHRDVWPESSWCACTWGLTRVRVNFIFYLIIMHLWHLLSYLVRYACKLGIQRIYNFWTWFYPILTFYIIR